MCSGSPQAQSRAPFFKAASLARLMSPVDDITDVTVIVADGGATVVDIALDGLSVIGVPDIDIVLDASNVGPPGPSGPPGSGGGGAGGVITPLPLAVFDFSDRSSVVWKPSIPDNTANWITRQPTAGAAAGLAVLESHGGANTWEGSESTYQEAALGGRSALVIASDSDFLFVGDAETPPDRPVQVVVAKLSETTPERPLVSANSGDYGALVTYDDDGTTRWCVGYWDWVDNFPYARYTDAPVDT